MVRILKMEAFLEHGSELHSVVRALIQEQQRIVRSTNPRERLSILWVAALVDKHITNCTNHEVGELLTVVQERFHIFEPEFALCHHAARRLLLRR